MKRFNKAALLFTVGALATAIAFAAQEAITLARVAKVGDEAEYKFAATLDFSGIKIDITGKTYDKVTKVDADGTIEVESTQSDIVVKTPDGEQTIDDKNTTKMTVGSDRVLKKYGDEGDEDASNIRLTLLGTVKKPEKPIKVGDKWSADLKHSNKETFPVKADYEAVALEKIGEWDTIKIKITTKETEGDEPASAEGFVWIVLADGTSAKEDMSIKNAPFAMSPTPIDMKVVVERTK